MLKFLQSVLINLSETYEWSLRALANYRASNDVNVFVVTVNVTCANKCNDHKIRQILCHVNFLVDELCPPKEIMQLSKHGSEIRLAVIAFTEDATTKIYDARAQLLSYSLIIFFS